MKKIVFLVLIYFLVQGCATGPQATTEKCSAICGSWLNHHINDLIDKGGYPSQSFKVPNGNTVYVFYHASQHTKPTVIMPVGQMYVAGGGETATYYRKTFFETAPNGQILKLRWEGNSCTAM